MPTYARIEAGVVVEIIQTPLDEDGNPKPLDECFTAEFCAGLIACGAQVRQGWQYEAGAFAEPAAPTTNVQPPRVVTMRQARLALLAAGKLQAVSDAIDALPSPQREAAQIEWDYASTVDRDSPFLQSLAGALALDDAALDVLFEQAAAL